MSPSRAGLSHSSSWKIFSSARLVTFFHSARNRKMAKTSWNFNNFESNWFMYLNYSFFTPKIPILLNKFIKLNIRYIIIMIEAQNWNLIVVPNYDLKFLSARFQLENWSAPARLDSARKFQSSGSLEPENSSSNSSLLTRFFGVGLFEISFFKKKFFLLHPHEN